MFGRSVIVFRTLYSLSIVSKTIGKNILGHKIHSRNQGQEKGGSLNKIDIRVGTFRQHAW